MVVVLLLLLLMVALFTFLFSYDFCFYLYFLFLSVRFIFSAGFRCICLLLAEGRGMCGEEAKQNPQMDIMYNVQFRREESCMGISCEIVSHFLRSGEEFY